MPGSAPIAAPPSPARVGQLLRWRPVGVACLGVAALSLVLLRQPSYDPLAWLIWGRELGSGSLDMIGGPSWKPLPVLLTVVFTRAGDATAPLLWLLVARAAGFAAVALAFGLARRLGGTRAGIVAALGLAFATDFLYNCLRGDSEGLLVAFALGAVSLHLSDRRHLALVSGLAAGLLRPEEWPLLAAYGLWLAWGDRRVRTLALVAGGGAALLALWFVPDALTTGDVLRGADRARNPVPGSPGQSAFPFGMAFVLASVFVCWPVYAGVVVAVRRAWRGPRQSESDRAVLALAGAAAGVMVVVGLLAQAGFTGNLRYATLPGALLCVVGGVGLPGLIAQVRSAHRPRLARAAVALAVVAAATSVAIVGWGGVRLVRDEQALGTHLDQVIAQAGGERAVRACGQIAATRFERQRVAWRLRLRSRDVWTHAPQGGTYFVRTGSWAPGATTLPVRLRGADWTLRSSCRPG